MSAPHPETSSATDDALREEIIRLGPWHQDVEVRPGISTALSLEAPAGTYDEAYPGLHLQRRKPFLDLLSVLYPGGLEGRRVLDCACNAGAYVFYAKEAGAGECLGFDVREHWIDQARFLAQHRSAASDGVRFEVADLYDLPPLGLEPFDLTLFYGIFYHLPDPIHGLRIAADLTSELLFIRTAVRLGRPDGSLDLEREGTTRRTTGVYGLSWLPTGPQVMERMLGQLGFPHVRASYVPGSARGQNPGQIRQPNRARLNIIASRRSDLIERLDASREVQSDEWLLPSKASPARTGARSGVMKKLASLRAR